MNLPDAAHPHSSALPSAQAEPGWKGPVGAGEMARRIREFDWAATSLGPLAAWPPALKHATILCLESRFPMHVWWGPDQIYLYNDAQMGLMGQSHPAGLGRPARESWGDIWPLLLPQVDAVMTRGEATWNDRVHVVTRRNGFAEDTWFTWSYSPIRDETGRIDGLLAVAIEETNRVQAERERDRLRERQLGKKSEDFAKNILESITDGFFALDHAWKFTFVNHQGEKILERVPGDLLGHSIWDVYPGLYDSEFGVSYRRCVTEKVAVSFTGFYPGHQRWYEAHAYPSNEGISVYFQDVTARLKTEGDLAETRRRLHAALEAGKITTWTLDLASGHIRSDSNAGAFFNLPPDHGLGYPVTAYVEAIHPEDRARTTALVDRAVATGEDFEAEYRIATFEPVKWAYGRARIEKDSAGQPVRLAGVVIDISERKRAEAERDHLLESERVARSDAERAGRLKDEFLATLSHELRTPLNAVIGWCEVLKAGARDAADLNEGLLTIERNARAQAKIIADMLDMSRIIAGKVRLEVERVDLAALLREAIATVQPTADTREVRIQPILDSSSPTVSGDPNRLQQVFWNLLSNSIKFTPKGGTIQVLLERVNSHLEVSVIDSGEGIDPKFLPHVFDRFRQQDSSTTRRRGGLGLGLSIVKSLVELHGGSVSAKSAGLGRGATFIIKLPSLVLHPEREDSSPGRREYPNASGPIAIDPEARRRLAGLRILVVDDEPDARGMVKRLLEDCQAVVSVAGSAQEALGELRKSAPDLLISDIGMPGEDGYSLIRHVRALAKEQGGNVPAVALTAYARSEDRTRSLLAGFQMHIAKPIEPSELIAVIATLATRR